MFEPFRDSLRSTAGYTEIQLDSVLGT